VNVLLVTAGKAVAWPVREALGAVAGVRAVAVVEVPEPAGRAELDPALDSLGDRRLVVAGSAAALGDIVTRLLRRDELGSTPVGVILGTATRASHRDDRSSAVVEPGAAANDPPADLAAAARIAATGVPGPTDLIRDDHGGVLLDRAELAPWTGRRLGMRVYVDDTRLVNGEIPGLAVVHPGGGGVRAEVWPERTRWRRPRRGTRGAPRASAVGRAVQVSCEQARLTLDGRVHPRPVTRRNWWLEPGRWLLVRPPEDATAHR